jgi:hypothetical protein
MFRVRAFRSVERCSVDAPSEFILTLRSPAIGDDYRVFTSGGGNETKEAGPMS